MSDQPDDLVLEPLRGMRRDIADQRREMADQRSPLLALADRGRRLERRVSEVRDDIGVMLKAELMGRPGNFEPHIEVRLDALAVRETPGH